MIGKTSSVNKNLFFFFPVSSHSPEPSAMSNVARGKLKLKKPMVPSEVSKSKVTKSKDKRDKKSKKEKSRKREEKKPKKEETEWEGLKVGMDPTLANMTPAERAYELAQRERVRLYFRIAMLRYLLFLTAHRKERG